MLWNYILKINIVLKETSLILCVSFHLAGEMAGMVSLSVLCSLNLIPRKLEQLAHTDCKSSEELHFLHNFLQEYKHEFLSPFANTQQCAFTVHICHHTSQYLHRISKAEPVYNCSEKVQYVNARRYFTSFKSIGFLLLKVFSELYLPPFSNAFFFN